MTLQRRREWETDAARDGAVVGRSSASLARRIADGSFWGYVGIAVSALLFQAGQDYRFGRSLARARLCIAQLDSTCVNRELEVESSIRSSDPRMEITGASLNLLLHRPTGPVQATADRLEAMQAAIGSTPAELRAELLLLRSDLAVANADLKGARQSLEAAQALLGESDLTVLRRRRIESLEKDVALRTANGVTALQQSFERLFEAAAAGNRTLVDVRKAACSDWIGRVADAGARRQLSLALQAGGRVNFARSAEPYRGVSSEPPSPPSKATGYDSNYGSGTFEERMQRYRERLARFEKEQASIQERERLRASEASTSQQAALDQAREALTAAVAALSASPAPFVESPPARVVGGSRSFEE